MNPTAAPPSPPSPGLQVRVGDMVSWPDTPGWCHPEVAVLVDLDSTGGGEHTWVTIGCDADPGKVGTLNDFALISGCRVLGRAPHVALAARTLLAASSRGAA